MSTEVVFRSTELTRADDLAGRRIRRDERVRTAEAREAARPEIVGPDERTTDMDVLRIVHDHAGKTRWATRLPRVGDRVTVRFGTSDAEGVVVEDRGPIGVNGRRLLRIEITLDPFTEPMAIEVPAEEARVIAA